MKILLLRLSSLGDVVLATAAANYLKAELPDAELYFLSREPYASLLEGQAALAGVWRWEGGLGAMRRRLKSEGIDALLDLQAKWPGRLLGLGMGLKSSRIRNYAWERRLLVWLKRQPLEPLPDVASRVVAAAASLIGREARASAPSLALDPRAKEWADAFLRDAGCSDGETLVGVCPGAAWATKRWPVAHFAAALERLLLPGRRFLFLGDSLDAALAQKISRMRPGLEASSLHAAGKTDLKQLAALLARCRMLLSNDSGPMHVATALGVPVLALFGPTVEAFGFLPQGPKDRVLQVDLSCRPCSLHGGQRCPIGTHECMESIQPSAVAEAALELLNA